MNSMLHFGMFKGMIALLIVWIIMSSGTMTDITDKYNKYVQCLIEDGYGKINSYGLHQAIAYSSFIDGSRIKTLMCDHLEKTHYNMYGRYIVHVDDTIVREYIYSADVYVMTYMTEKWEHLSYGDKRLVGELVTYKYYDCGLMTWAIWEDVGVVVDSLRKIGQVLLVDSMFLIGNVVKDTELYYVMYIYNDKIFAYWLEVDCQINDLKSVPMEEHRKNYRIRLDYLQKQGIIKC